MADTRRQILLTIKDQARLLREPVGPLDPSRQHRWSPQQWWESFTFLVRKHLQRLSQECRLIVVATVKAEDFARVRLT
jgi:hypothetical protein